IMVLVCAGEVMWGEREVEQLANEDTESFPSLDTPIVQSVSISKPVLYARAADFWGHKSFARFLIEVRAYATLKDSVIMGIPFPNVVSNIDKMNNDGFQMMVNKRKSGKTCYTINNRSGATADNPFKKLSAKKGGPHVPSCKPSVLTFNPYYVLDDMDSEEEAKVF
nr:hypothetical protein [Tanacetum cinerariifolium]